MPAYNVGEYSAGSYGIGGAPSYTRGVEYYVDLITSEYRVAHKFIAKLRNTLQKMEDVSLAMYSFEQAFNPELAVGVQLDTAGLIAGVSRTVTFQPSNGVSPVLDDATYRLLIKAKISQNLWDGRITSISAIWTGLFPNGSIVVNDNHNMTATILLTGAFSSITQDLITNGFIVPRPETVQYTYVFPTLPVFGADQNNAYVAGADLGHAV